jgi:protein CpxP
MTAYRPLVSSAVLLAMLGAFAVPAVAAPAAPHECGPGGQHGMHMDHRRHDKAAHHQKLHDDLKLSAEQEAGWTKLMASEHPMSPPKAAAPEAMAKLTTPERVEQMLERMKAAETQMAGHLAALNTVYATLTDEQKKVFDDAHAAPKAGMNHKHKQKHRAPAADKAEPKG